MSGESCEYVLFFLTRSIQGPQAKAVDPDEPSAEEYAEFRKRLGRWRRETISAILNPLWWITLQVASRAREPLTHHFAFIRTSNTCNVLEKMVHGKAEVLASEMVSLASLNAKFWAKPIVISVRECPETLPVDLSDVLELGVSLNLHHHAAYWRRVVLDCKRLPTALFLLSHEPPDRPCAKRQRLAKFIIDTPHDQLESNTRKLRGVCIDEFRQCAADGTIGPVLHSLATSWSSTAKGDVAINEGHNSLIKAINGRCRNIGLPLLSARANAKKELKVGVRGAPVKWSQVKHAALAMVQD